MITALVLYPGCGNSPLSEFLYKDGFKNVENIDYSQVVIDRMSSHCDHCSRMGWHVMDATQLRFQDASFDVVLEKATLDAMMVSEKDPWNVSDRTKSEVTRVLGEVHAQPDALHNPVGIFQKPHPSRRQAAQSKMFNYA